MADRRRLTRSRCSRLSKRCTSLARSIPSRLATAIWLRLIGADDGHHGILRRADIDGAERANKILKNPDLEAPHRIAGVAGQRVEGDLVIHDVALCVAVSLAAGRNAAARLRAIWPFWVFDCFRHLSFYRLARFREDCC